MTSGDLAPCTSFREWMHQLRARGDRPEWPTLLCRVLETEFARQRELPIRYDGAAVFIDREDIPPDSARPGTEKRAVRDLFGRSRWDPSGCLWVGETPYWLLSYEIPCCARATKRCGPGRPLDGRRAGRLRVQALERRRPNHRGA
jgi:hypothetical protein